MRRFIALFLIAVLGISLCACGNTNRNCEFCKNTRKVECSCSRFKEMPDGKVDCSACFAGKVPCSKCNDLLGHYGTELCPNCEGSGIIRNPLTWEAFGCGKCDGEGRIPADCPQCNGKGDLGEECSVCDGTGKVPCDKCNGTMKIPCGACSYNN